MKLGRIINIQSLDGKMEKNAYSLVISSTTLAFSFKYAPIISCDGKVEGCSLSRNIKSIMFLEIKVKLPTHFDVNLATYLGVANIMLSF